MNARKRKIKQSTFQHNSDPDTQEPIIVPLYSLQDVEKWEVGCDEFCKASTPISNTKLIIKDSPKTIICHDMMGGYHDDRFVQGVHKDDITSYCFYNWQYIDTFIYFSHSFITIPPPGWTNAAHKHGTKVLGTIISEWEGGEIIWESILRSEESYQSFASKVVSIAKYYGFDGWLINIECKIEKCQDNLVMFLQYLTNEMHASISHSEIIWYDSILQDGTLLWQDCLNEMNECFFHVTDGIFLNYNWTSEKLQSSYQRAGSRHWDVYVGVDIWGRSGKHQEGFDAHIAVKDCLQHQLSIALFAPAWTYEYNGKDDFCSNENQFWYTLSKVFKCRRSLDKLPLATSFCEGQGKKIYQQGKIISQSPWLNLSCQQNQPSFRRYHPRDYHITRRECDWQMCAKTGTSTKSAHFRLYHCNIEITEPYFIFYSFQLLQDVSSDVNLELTFYNKNRSNKEVIHVTSSPVISKDGEIAIEQIENYSQLLCLGVDPKLDQDQITRIFLIKPTSENGVIKVLERVSIRVQLPPDSPRNHVNILLKEVKIFQACDGCCKSLKEIVCQPEDDFLSFISWSQMAYNGGNCLKLSGLFTEHPLKFRLFECAFEMPSSVVVTYTYNVVNDVDVALDLTLQSSNLIKRVRLQDSNLLEEGIDAKIPVKKDLPALLQYDINVERDFKEGWITRVFILQVADDTILQEVMLTCGLSSAASNQKIDIFLGEIRVLPLTYDDVNNIEDCDFFELSIDFSNENFNLLTCILSWRCTASIQWFNIFYNLLDEEEPVFLGFTHNKLYKVCNLRINKVCELKFASFFIQPISTFGMPISWHKIQVPIK